MKLDIYYTCLKTLFNLKNLAQSFAIHLQQDTVEFGACHIFPLEKPI